MGRPRKNIDAAEVFRLRLQGLSWRQIAATTGLGLGTVFRAQAAALNSLAAFQNRRTRYPVKWPEPQSSDQLVVRARAVIPRLAKPTPPLRPDLKAAAAAGQITVLAQT
jgi:hypothetical protein